ncbi:DUF885 domain-containing protein [Streptomyces lushanensis]|uniref:DUF885 domain-containing protein n=1 Tax=Streptomyces lushanensis TaxID=1434255 RepID=UPI000831F757|nr:DUF885 domain-containing protein [Streptomyces lushanensis]
MSDTTRPRPLPSPAAPSPPPRHIADAYTDDLIALDPVLGTIIGDRNSHDGLPDFSPDGGDQLAKLAADTLRRLAATDRQAVPDTDTAPGGADDGMDPGTGPDAGSEAAIERNCARLLRERLTAELAMHETGETLRSVSTIYSPVHRIRTALTLTPTADAEDWRAVARRLRALPASLESYRAALAEGLRRGLPAGPRQITTMAGQLDEWIGPRGGWFGRFVAPGPEALRKELESAAQEAAAAVGRLRNWLGQVYAPGVAGAPEVVGRERYAVCARYFNGTDLDLDEAYEYGWSEFHRLLGEMRTEAARIRPDAATPWTVLRHLDTHGHAVEGEEAVRAWLQDLMDEAVGHLGGTHFDIAGRIARVESCLAPAGGGPAPYYTSPSQDFSRPGRTWLPTMGRTRFPTYELVSTWYHEGVPGHHLQLAQWAHLSDRLSRYQTGVATVSANTEGWALYAERLMDELGFLTDPEHRLGHLDMQMMRAVRVVIDLGMHLELTIPAHSPFRPGARWTPALAEEFFRAHSGRPDAFVRGEMIRYLGTPGQAIGYKLGERVWLRGREAARTAHLRDGREFDLKRWHMAALSQGSLGLDDLEAVLAEL